MKSAIEILDAFENIRRAQRAGVFAPHKPLLILLALARVQRGEPRLVEFAAIDDALAHSADRGHPFKADRGQCSGRSWTP